MFARMSQSLADLPREDPILVRFRSAWKGFSATASNASCCSVPVRAAMHRPISDYDIAIFLNDFVDRRQEVRRMVPLVTDIIEEMGAVIHPMPYRAGAWRERTPLMHEIRRDGVDL